MMGMVGMEIPPLIKKIKINEEDGKAKVDSRFQS